MKNRKFLMIGAGIAGIFLLVCITCIALVYGTTSSPSFQATATAQALAHLTQSTQIAPSVVSNAPTAIAKSTPIPSPTPLPPPATPVPPTVMPTATATPTSTATPVPVKVSAKQTVNVRQGPGTQYAVMEQLPANTSAAVIGKSADGQWYQIALPSATNPGWVSASVVGVTGPDASLQIITVAPVPTPTRTGIGELTPINAGQKRFVGNGSTTLPEFNLSTGFAVFHVAYHGDSTFVLFLIDIVGKDTDVLVAPAEAGAFEGTMAIGIDHPGKYQLKTSTTGSWIISVEQPQSSAASLMLPQTFRGRGTSISPMFKLDSGLVAFTLTHKGNYNFTVDLIDERGNSEMFVIEGGDFNGTHALGIESKAVYMLSIFADGDWSISVTQPRAPSNPPSPPQIFKGHGKQITPMFRLNRGIVNFWTTHDATDSEYSLCQVELLDSNGTHISLIENAVIKGQHYESIKALNISQPGIYLLDIDADGDWTVKVEQ